MYVCYEYVFEREDKKKLFYDKVFKKKIVYLKLLVEIFALTNICFISFYTRTVQLLAILQNIIRLDWQAKVLPVLQCGFMIRVGRKHPH